MKSKSRHTFSILLISILLLFGMRVEAQQPVELEVDVLNFYSDTLELEVYSEWIMGPPAPDFLGYLTPIVNVDTLFILPIYEWNGIVFQFSSHRTDTILVEVPPGVSKVFVNSGMKMYDNPPGPMKDTLLSMQDTTIFLSALSAAGPVERISESLLHPNPCSSYLRVPDIDFTRIEFFDLMSRLVMTFKPSSSNKYIYLENLESGIYFARIWNKNKFRVQKIFVQ